MSNKKGLDKQNRRLRIYRISTCVALICVSICLGIYGYMDLYYSVPSLLRVKSGERVEVDLNFPLTYKMKEMQVSEVSVREKSNVPPNMESKEGGELSRLAQNGVLSYVIDVRLFGIFPFKEVGIQVIEDETLTPMGIPIGIYVKLEGILVVGVGEFEGEEGAKWAPSKDNLKIGDYILEFNGEEIDSKYDFMEKVEESEGKEITLGIKREDEIMEVRVVPKKNSSGEYKLGIWLRDNAQGVGTMTYMDGDGNFGALGHGINDVDTSSLFELKDGTLYDTEIISIKKGKKGEPGEMTGMICYTKDYVMGDVNVNSNQGIFGTCNEKALGKVYSEALPIGLKQELELGEAYVYCTIDEEPAMYTIEITGIHMDHENLNRGIELEVTDPTLLAVTGGIVQGMSGSPIIQNGKIMGAVTHVLVNDPTKGYGIFIEEMLEH